MRTVIILCLVAAGGNTAFALFAGDLSEATAWFSVGLLSAGRLYESSAKQTAQGVVPGSQQ